MPIALIGIGLGQLAIDCIVMCVRSYHRRNFGPKATRALVLPTPLYDCKIQQKAVISNGLFSNTDADTREDCLRCGCWSYGILDAHVRTLRSEVDLTFVPNAIASLIRTRPGTSLRQRPSYGRSPSYLKVTIVRCPEARRSSKNECGMPSPSRWFRVDIGAL